jgi:long-chain acyl-CoA synthetase
VVTLVDALRARAERLGARTALVSDAPPERISYAALVEHMDRVATHLRAAGVAPGERCGLFAPQGPRFVQHALGILAAGACLVPIADELGAAGIEAVRREARLAHVVRVPVASGEPMQIESGEREPFAHEESFRALRPCYLRFTSGTTSRRKGVVLGHATVQARLDAANAALRVGPADVVLWLLPMAHHFVVSILLYLREGATILLPASTLARPALRLGAREGATLLYASPFHHQLLARDAGSDTLAHLRLAVSTAEGLRADVAEAFRARFGRPLVQALGVIECGLPLMNLVAAARKPEAIGRPLPGFDVWLRDETGAEVKGSGPTHAGELCIRGPGLFDAYLEPWTPASELLVPDGFRTGDQAWRDEDGDLQLAGRRANRINVAGMKFFCEEVESVLDAHPEVERSRVSPRQHAHVGEVPVASVIPRDPSKPPAADRLRAFCRERLPAHKVPREIVVVSSLPTTATGKLVRWSGEAAG